MKTHLFALAFISLGWTNIARADSATLTALFDTTLNEASPNNNLGGHTHVLAGTDGLGRDRRGLFYFDVAEALPAGAVVQSASLFLFVNSANENSGTFGVYRMLRAWQEGRGIGAQGQAAQPGEATWNNRIHPGTPWGAAGGLAGADFVAASSSTTLVEAPGNYEFAGLGGDVQAMLDNPASNYGWMLRSLSEGAQGTARQFIGSELVDGELPTLVIDYSVIPEPSSLVLAAVGAAMMVVVRQRFSTTVSNERVIP